MRILLADDDTGVIQSLLAILKSVPGYEVRVATTGERALENAAALGGVDLLITDVVMEPMDGFTLRDEMVTRYPEMRTMLISGYDLSDYPEQTQHHQTLAKPIDSEALLAAIEREFAAPPEPEPVPVPVAVPVARPIAVPQAKAVQPRAVAQPVAQPAAVPQPTARPAGQPIARAIATPQPTAQPTAKAVAAPQATAQPAVKPVAVPQATAQPTVKAVAAPQPTAQPVARPVAVPQATAQPAVRAIAAPQATAKAIAAPQATAQPAVRAVATPQTAAARPVSVPQAQPTARPVAQPVAQAPRAVAAPRAVSQPAVGAPRAIPVGQPVARAVAAVPVAQPPAETPDPAVEEAAPEPAADSAEASPSEPDVVPAAESSEPFAVEPPAAQTAPEPDSAPAAELPPEPQPAADAAPAAELAPEPAPEAQPEPDLSLTGLVGQNLGAYRILRKLGEGRWGTVYAAVQTAINRPVGLKVLDPAQALDAGARARFIADARAKAAVQHPSILAVYEAGEAGGYIFFAHEYVEGRTMAEIKEAGEKLNEQTALKVLRTAADGLAYFTIHKTPHSPPEPGTIFLGADGNARLGNLATQLGDQQLPVEAEIQALGRILLGVLPAIQSLTPGMQDLVKRMVQKGPQAFTSWGPLLQGIKAIEPKIVPVEAAKISAQDRAAVAAVETLRKKRKRSLYINLGSFVSLTLLAGYFVVRFIQGSELVYEQIHIPEGEFLFGNGEPVTLSEFWIDKYEVTYGQYAKFVQHLENRPTTEYDDPRQPRIKAPDMHKPKNWEIYYQRAKAGKPVHSVPIDLNCPVMEIDWWDAAAYAKWKGRELPTEQEWEKAARGTKGFIYPWGDEPDVKKANSNADWHGGNPDAKADADGFVYWNRVDAMKNDKSSFGAVGMAGNVAEWISTWDAAKKRPIIKGGSFMSADVRLDRRSELPPESISEAIGFRTISRTPPAKK